VWWELRGIAAECCHYQTPECQLDALDLGVKLAKLRR
jgi:hypothetical protein